MRYFFFCLFLVCSSAQAGIYLEPAVGYENGKLSETYTNPGTPAAVTSSRGGGITTGVKGGFHQGPVFLGAEYERSHLGEMSKPKDWSGFAGISIPLVRAWVSYIFSAKTGLAKGTGYKVGAGTSLFLFLSLNAEYSVRNYKTYMGPALATGTTYKGDLKSVKVTVSLPLGF
ncbi:MAG: hypothetical protein ACXWQO_18485 [Bdellovibrionota bacterium]